jgi:hypothetical protein
MTERRKEGRKKEREWKIDHQLGVCRIKCGW